MLENRRSIFPERLPCHKYEQPRHRCNNIMCNLDKNLTKIAKQRYKPSLCRELKTYYTDPHFNEIRNTHPCIHYAENGVIDTRDGNYVLRPGKPQDYISKP